VGDGRLSKTLGRILWFVCLAASWPRGAGAESGTQPVPEPDAEAAPGDAGRPPLPQLMAQAAAQPDAAAAAPEEEESPGWGLAPVRTGWNGSVGLTFSAPFGDQTSGNTTTFQTTLNGFLDTYVWQPWYVRLYGNAGVTWFTGSSSGGGSADSYSITGAGRVSVFPVSRFPFQAYLERIDSRVTGEILSTNFTTTRMGALQNYANQDGTLNLQGSWDRSVLAQRGISDTLDVFQATYRQVIPTLSMTHLLNGQARYNVNNLSVGKSRTYDASLQHNVRPWDELTLISDASASGSELRGLRNASADSYQVGSVAVWNSPDRPLTVTGAARVALFSADAGDQSGDITTINLNLGGNYALNRNVALTAGVNLQTQTDQTTSTFEVAGVSYTGDPLDWQGWSLYYGGAANVINQTGTNSSLDLQATGNYSAQRPLGDFLGGQTLFSFGQGLLWNAVGAEEGQAFGNLTSTAALNWSRYSGARQTSINFSLNDSREFGGLQNAVQLINLQANLNEALSPSSSWNGNLTVQSSRQERQGSSGEGFVTSLSAAAGYTQGRLFNVPRLLFTTTLFASTVNFQRSEGNLDPLTSQYSLTWDNRLFYPIGKTEFELRVQATETKDQTQGIVFFRVTRLLN